MAADTALLEVGVMFVAIAIAGGIAIRLSQSVIPFYVLAGMALSEYVVGSVGLPFVPVSEFITLGAELGIVFLLFFLGLEFSLDRFLANKTNIGKIGLLDFGINFSIGFGIGIALGWPVFESLLLAGIVYISSSAVITKSLIDLGWTANPEADPMLGTLVFEDLVIAVYLAVITAIILGGNSMSESLPDVGMAIGVILLLLLFVYIGTGLLDELLAVDSVEQMILRGVGVVVLIAGAALTFGVSEAVAAFFVGMAVSSTNHVEAMEDLLEPLRDVFAAVFFFWIGLITNPFLFGSVVGLVLLTVILTSGSKFVTGFYSGRLYGLASRRSIRVGCGMVTRGEFSLIIASIAATGSGTIMTEVIPAFAVAYVLVMSILGTMLMQHMSYIESLVGFESAPDTAT